MNHDLTHCYGGEQCNKKKTCHRYIAHLDVKKQEPRWWGYSYMDPIECIDGEYNMYWKEK